MKVCSSYVNLDNLRFHAFHGVLPQERLTGNDYVVNLHIKYDFSRAMESDDVADTLNYAEVYQVVAREMQEPSQLLERVAGRIGESLLAQFPRIEELHLEVVKQNPPMGADCEGAGVEVHLINDKTLK